MTLDLFKKIEDISDEKLHHKFKLLRDNPLLSGERDVIESWTDGFIDRDNKIVKEFQTSFHSTFWEFYVFQLLKESGIQLDFSHNRPDFIVKSPINMYVEAVVSEIKAGGRKEETRSLDDVVKMLEPFHLASDFKETIDEAITRHSNSIMSKCKKYNNEYLGCSWVEKSAPFVIALGSYDQVNYGRESHHSLVPLLYGKYFNPQNQAYDDVKEITKPGTDAKIPIGLFNDRGLDYLSAVIFSCTTTLGKLTALSISKKNPQFNFVLNIRHDTEPPHFPVHVITPETPEELSDGVFIFHNPFAKNKLPLEAFSMTNAIQVSMYDGNLLFEGENLPIVSRFNCTSILLPETLKAQFVTNVFHAFNLHTTSV